MELAECGVNSGLLVLIGTKAYSISRTECSDTLLLLPALIWQRELKEGKKKKGYALTRPGFKLKVNALKGFDLE